jgi:hypothetical protein
MQDIIRKIQKALALANGNANANESQTAMLLAQRLMAENNINMAQVDIKYQEQKVATKIRAKIKKRLDWWAYNLADIIAKNFKCYAYINQIRGTGSRVVFLGLEQDAQVALELFNYAVTMIKHHSTSYIRKNNGNSRSDTNAIKNDYIRGYLKGLEDKFIEQVTTLDLVVLKDQVVVSAYKNLKISSTPSRGIRTSHNQGAYDNGYRTGKSFNNKQLN